MTEEDTQPNTLPRPPPPQRWWWRVRRQMGTAGLVALIVAFLAGITLAASLFPGVRHGVGKVVTHHSAPAVKSQLATPSLRDGSPRLSPSSFTRETVGTPVRTAGTVPPRRRASTVPSATRRAMPTPTTRVVPTVTPTAQPTTPAPTTTEPVPTPTPTVPVPTTPAPSTASVSATVTTVPPPSFSS